MTSIRDTLWPIEPHTIAKHRILRNYLYAWLPIMTSWSGKVVYIDGFAGPGRYQGGEEGSPVIALRAALEHKQPIKSEIVFYFIEERRDRYEYLERLLADMFPSLPSNVVYYVRNAAFDENLTQVLDALDANRKKLAPTFAFIDPFGYSQTPFSVVERMMQNAKCEVLVNFNYEELNRFLELPSQSTNFDAQFGSDRWRQCVPLKNPGERRDCIHNTYKRQLETAARVKYVRSFEMLNDSNRTDYYLFFGTNSYAGLTKMKHAMWRVDPLGRNQFSDATFNPSQPTLFSTEPDFAHLKRLLTTWGTRLGEDVRIEQVERFVVEDTPFLDTHYKRQVLVPLERAGHLTVKGGVKVYQRGGAKLYQWTRQRD